MKKRILSLFLAFSLAAGIGVVGAGNTSEASYTTNVFDAQGTQFSQAEGNTLLWSVSSGAMVNGPIVGNIRFVSGDGLNASAASSSAITGFTADGAGNINAAAPVPSQNSLGWSWTISDAAMASNANVTLLNGTQDYVATVTDGWFQGSDTNPIGQSKAFRLRVSVPKGSFVSNQFMGGVNVPSMAGASAYAVGNGYTFVNWTGTKGKLPKGNLENDNYFMGYVSGAARDGGYAGSNPATVASAGFASILTGNDGSTNEIYKAIWADITNNDKYIFDYSDFVEPNTNIGGLQGGQLNNLTDGRGGYGASDSQVAAGTYTLPNISIDGVNYGSWDEIDPRNGNVLRASVGNVSPSDDTGRVRVFKLRGSSSQTTNAYLSGSYTFGETVKASAGLTTNNASVSWYVARFDSNNNRVGNPILLRQGTGRDFYELVIRDIYATSANRNGYTNHEWNWNVVTADINHPTSPTLANAGDTWRIMYTATDNGRTYNSNWSTITRKVLDRRDFVYGSAGESYATWETGANNNESNVIDPQFRENNANVLVKLNNLNMEGYSFDIRYRDASQALDVNKGSRYDLSYQTNEGAQDYGYQFMTGEQLRTSGQAGRYGVYVVGVYQAEGNRAAGTNASAGLTNGTNGTVAIDNANTPARGNRDNMFRVNQNTQTTTQVAQWGYALKDDDKATTLGDKSAGANVPALFIGTLNVGKAKWPAAANAHPVATLENIYNGNNSSGYIVGSKFRAEEVGIPTRYKMLDTFEWFRVDDSDNWTSTGKTGATYTASADDVGYRIGVKVSNANYEGTIQGETHQVIGKQSIDVNFTTGSQYREGHFTPGGKMVVDLRSDLKNFGKALGDVEFDMSGHGTFESGKYIAENNSLEFTFRDVATVPSTFAPYKVNAVVEFPGFNVAVKGDVRGTANDVTTVVIEPIEDKTYDGVAVSTTAKAYVNGEEVSDGSQVTVTYSGNTNGPKDAGKYVATASYKGATATAAFEIKKVKLAPSDKFPREYGIERALPVDLTGYFPQIVNGDNINIHNYVTKYEFKYDTTPGFEETAATPNGQRLSKVFYTPTFDIGNWEYYVQFVPVGMSGDWVRNYDAPDPVKIKVGTGYVNASSSNISNNEPYAEQVARVNRLWKEGSVHRMVLAGGGDYLYTSSKKEALYNVRTGEWTFDDVLFKGVAEGTVGAKELVRLDNKGQRVTTIKDSKEYNYLLEKGYVDNGRIAFVYTEKADGAVPYNRLYYPKTGTHMLQNPDNNEFKVLIDGGSWKDEGTQFYAPQG